MESIEDVVLSFCQTEGWDFAPDDRADLLRGTYQGESGTWPCFFWIREAEKQVVFYSLAPFLIPEASQDQALRQLMSWNMDQVIGSFEMDTSSGAVRMRVALDAHHFELSSPILRRAVLANLLSFDGVLPALREMVQASLLGEASARG